MGHEEVNFSMIEFEEHGNPLPRYLTRGAFGSQWLREYGFFIFFEHEGFMGMRSPCAWLEPFFVLFY